MPRSSRTNTREKGKRNWEAGYENLVVKDSYSQPYAQNVSAETTLGQWENDERDWIKKRTIASGETKIYYDDSYPGPELAGQFIVQTSRSDLDSAVEEEPAESYVQDESEPAISQLGNGYYSINTQPSQASSDIGDVTAQFASTSLTDAPAGNQGQSTGQFYTATETLDSRYETIVNGSKFFKVGRVFKILWTETAGNNIGESEFVTRGLYGEKVFSKIRPFIVVREQKGGCCLCVPMYTYGGLATKKPGINPMDHAMAYDVRKNPILLPGEKKLRKLPIAIKIENTDKFEPTTRINFARIYTIEHNVKALKVGRVIEKHIPLLKKYYKESIVDDDEPIAQTYPQQPYPLEAYTQQAYPQQPYPQDAYTQQAYPQQAYFQGAYPHQASTYQSQPSGYQAPNEWTSTGTTVTGYAGYQAAGPSSQQAFTASSREWSQSSSSRHEEDEEEEDHEDPRLDLWARREQGPERPKTSHQRKGFGQGKSETRDKKGYKTRY